MNSISNTSDLSLYIAYLELLTFRYIYMRIFLEIRLGLFDFKSSAENMFSFSYAFGSKGDFIHFLYLQNLKLWCKVLYYWLTLTWIVWLYVLYLANFLSRVEYDNSISLIYLTIPKVKVAMFT